jgi:hypothetical protein
LPNRKQPFAFVAVIGLSDTVHTAATAWRCSASTMRVVHAAPLDFDHMLRFDGCFNFRDLGGYRTQDGRWTRPQRLYRADGPHALSQTDAARLDSLALTTIIDLRTPDEVARGCYTTVVSDVVEYHLPMTDVLPTTDDLRSWVDPVVVADRYRDMLDA